MANEPLVYNGGRTGQRQPNVDINLLSQRVSTGWLDGCVISINGGDPTTFDMTSGAGRIVDNYTDTQADPDKSGVIPFAGVTAEAVTVPAEPFVFVFVNRSGNATQLGNVAKSDDLRDLWLCGVLVVDVPGGNVIVDTIDMRVIGYDQTLDIYDQLIRDQPRNIAGNSYGPSIVAPLTLQMFRSAGQIFFLGANAHLNKKRPSVIDTGSEDPVADVQYLRSDGLGGFQVGLQGTIIRPANWDDGSGTLQTVTQNRWGSHRLYFGGRSGAPQTIALYPVAVYNSEQEAIDNAFSEPFDEPAFLGTLFVYRSIVVVRGGATDLQPGNATFLEVTRIGTGSSGSGGTGEDNDGLNVGTGVGVFDTKAGITLQFRSINSPDSSIGLLTNGQSIEAVWPPQAIVPIDLGAPAGSLRVDGNGDLGVRTAVPAFDIHATAQAGQNGAIQIDAAVGFLAAVRAKSGLNQDVHLQANTDGSISIGNGTNDDQAKIDVAAPNASIDVGATGQVTIPNELTCPDAFANSERFGAGASVNGVSGTAVGQGATAGNNSAALGKGASANGVGRLALGQNTFASGDGAIAIGTNANAPGVCLSVGDGANSGGTLSTTIGSGGAEASVNGVAVGNNALAGGSDATALGRASRAGGANSVAVGTSADAPASGSVCIGKGAATDSPDTVSVGRDATAQASEVTVVGATAQSLSSNAVAVGFGAIVDGGSGVAVGSGATANNLNMAFGRDCVANDLGLVQFGSAAFPMQVIKVVNASQAMGVGFEFRATLHSLGNQNVPTAASPADVSFSQVRHNDGSAFGVNAANGTIEVPFDGEYEVTFSISARNVNVSARYTTQAKLLQAGVGVAQVFAYHRILNVGSGP